VGVLTIIRNKDWVINIMPLHVQELTAEHKREAETVAETQRRVNTAITEQKVCLDCFPNCLYG
jgi:hypothetical protein